MYHISDLLPKTDTTCTKLDEVTLNEFFDTLPAESFEKFVKPRFPEPSNKRKLLSNPVKMPQNLKSSIMTLRLLDEPSYNKRIELFVGYCLFKGYTYLTAVKYFSIMKHNDVFGSDYASLDLRPCKIAFVDSGRPHIRVVSMDNFITFIRYLNKNLSCYTAPVLVAAHTCLRTNEILQFSSQTLFELESRRKTVSIRLKQTLVNPEKNEPIHWQPIYTSHLNIFIKNLITLYYDEYAVFISKGINVRLFNITPKTLSNRTKSLYFNATGLLAPNGFSNHSFRNMIATAMATKTDNIVGIQRLLNHHSIKTTKRYIRENYQEKTRQEIDRLTKVEFANVRANLEAPVK